MGTTRDIKKIGADHIDEYMYIYLNAYPAYKTLDEDCQARYREKTLTEMKKDRDVEFYGCFEKDKLVAQMKLVTFKMNVYGQMQKAMGLMALSVHPLHKKQGIAFDMVKFYEEHALDKGAQVAVLLPFHMGFYRKMGYGFGSKLDEYRIPADNLPEYLDFENLRPLTGKDVKKVIKCYDAFCEMNHGMMKKFDEEKRQMEEDTSILRVGYFDGNKLIGYLAYHFLEDSPVNYTRNTIVVDELVYFDGSVLQAFLGYLNNQADLAQTVVIRTGEADFYHMLDNAADISQNYIPYGYLQTNVSAVANMYKVLDPAAFVEATSYRAFPRIGLTVAFSFHDEITDKERRLVLKFEKSEEERKSSWKIADYDDIPDVSIQCLKSDLSSLLMGSARLGALIRLGVMDISDPDYTDMLDVIFYHGQRPYSNNDF